MEQEIVIRVSSGEGRVVIEVEGATVRVSRSVGSLAHDAAPLARSVAPRFTAWAAEYSRKDRRVAWAAARWFAKWAEENAAARLDDTRAMREYRDYLYARLNGGTPANYFKKLREFADGLVEEGALRTNAARGVPLTYSSHREKRALTDAELSQLCGAVILSCDSPTQMSQARIPAPHGRAATVASAFLFACYTGLRWCDVRRLAWENIDMERGTLTLTQQKVAGHSRCARLHVPLCSTARAILAAKGQPPSAGEVFRLPSYDIMRCELRRWLAARGVGGGVTFHSARHTFISRLVACGVDIKTVADLAGHASTRHTERYAHADGRHLRESVARLDGGLGI